jgi:uncharacterized membrane protein
MPYLVLKWLHILSSTFLFGTGIGSAFYMLFASLTRDARVAAVVVKYVVIADLIFTLPTIIFQPLSGFYLAQLAGFPLRSRWIIWSAGLYFLALLCWLPVVWIQIKMRDLARDSASTGAALPISYWRHLMLWVALGIIAFFSFVTVFYLMVTKTT